MTPLSARSVSETPTPSSGHGKRYLSELMGTYILVFVGPAAAVVASLAPGIPSFE